MNAEDTGERVVEPGPAVTAICGAEAHRRARCPVDEARRRPSPSEAVVASRGGDNIGNLSPELLYPSPILTPTGILPRPRHRIRVSNGLLVRDMGTPMCSHTASIPTALDKRSESRREHTLRPPPIR